MKDSTEMHTCGLEMKGGLNGVDYAQKFMKAPEAMHPSKAPSTGKETPVGEVMNMVMCR